jgi:beta-1,4-N-acetylglucosaminyltransferase
MIFVTVGTFQFDALVRHLDEAVEAGRLSGEVLMQIGNGAYQPRSCPYFDSAPSLAPYYERADLVVCHGGTGTVFEVLEYGLPAVGLANPAMQDNHQHAFLSAMEREGCLWYCRQLERVLEFIQLAREQRLPGLHQWKRNYGIARAIESAPLGETTRLGSWQCYALLRRWALRLLGRMRLPPDSLYGFHDTSFQDGWMTTDPNRRANLGLPDLPLDQDHMVDRECEH